MKKLVLISFALFVSLLSFAQTDKVNLVVFSDDGDKFYLVINGIRQNIKSETNVRITDLTTESFSFKIIFEDTKLAAISKTQYLPFGNEYTFRIKTDKKGKRAMKPFGQSELSQPSTNTGSTTIIYHTTEEVPITTTTSTTGTTGTGAAVTTNVSGTNTGAATSVGTTGGTKETTTTTTSTTTTTNGGTSTGTTGVGMNVNVSDNTNAGGGTVTTGVNAGGIGINMDVKVTDNGASINMGGTGMGTGTTTTGGTTTSATGGTGSNSTTTYSSTTTTTTTTSSGTGTGISTNVNTSGTGVTNSTNTTGTTNSTYTGTSNYACGAAMTTTDFETAKKSISAKSFEDSKLTIAKQVTKANCLSAAQIKEVMGLFDFEASKLDYAKYAYDYCYDKNSYYKLNDAFDFESSVDELNQYIEKK